jgi:hypothetical protein
MRRSVVSAFLGTAGLLAAVPASAHTPHWDSPGSLVSVSVEVEGRTAPLYPAPDGSGRFYLEAREGARYAVTLGNRTHERLGVVLTVDGLNAISGERGRNASCGGCAPSGLGRMYVLDPYGSASIKGWRTSLEAVRRFTFVDERASYAARSGKANSKMGWIEVEVFRERPRPYVYRSDPYEPYRTDPYAGARDERARDSADASGSKRDGEAGGHAEAAEADRAERSSPRAQGPMAKAPAPSTMPPGGYPGTGWGAREDDRAMLVDFEPQSSPSEVLTLRYEYGSALRALGILPAPWWARDRLREREAGSSGFAKPPRW